MPIGLYGNVMGALVRLRHTYENKDAEEICSNLWCHLTEGERYSSREKRVVWPNGRSAHGTWILTLKGDAENDDPISRSYQTAKNGIGVSIQDIVPENTGFLPPRLQSTVDICNFCPVKDRCFVWEDVDL
jgi:hypothetical protein